MTRIESTPQTTAPSLKGKIIKVLKAVMYVITLPFRFSLKGVIALLIVVVFILVLLTGIWTVPIASAIVYHEPKPVREVERASFSESLFEIQTEQKLNDSSFGVASIELTEKQLNALFLDTVAKQESFAFSSAQLAIENGYLEFFGRISARPQTVVRAHIVPYIDNQTLRLRIDKVIIGQLPLPTWVTPSSILNAFTPSLVSSILDKATVESVDLTKGKIHLDFQSL